MKLHFKVLALGMILFNGSLLRSQTSCGNLDFEQGNYTGWNLYKGVNGNSILTPTAVTSYTNQSITTGANKSSITHCLISGSGVTDSILGQSIVSPYGSNNLIRLNHIGAGYEAAILEKQIVVNVNQPYVNFSYFAVLQAKSHAFYDQPYFRFSVLDASHNVIQGSLLQTDPGMSTLNPGYIQFQTGTWIYKPWTSFSIDLSAYAGQTVTLQYIAADCPQGGHGGYAYLDIDCNQTSPVSFVVWPGDANYDLSVNFQDMFNVGSAYGQTGTARSVAGNTWAAAASADWATQSLHQLNSKHADCDGNGTINANDTASISLNYGLSHPARNSVQVITLENKVTLKPLNIVASVDTVTEGENFHLDFKVGTSTNPIDSIYAIGFTINYPSYLLDQSAASVNYTASVVGTNLLKLSKPLGQTLDLAVSRINQQNALAVSGNVFSLNLKAVQTFSTDATVQFNLTNIKALTKSGYVVQLESTPASVEFKKAVASGIQLQNANSDILLFPNPSHDKLTVSLGSATIIQSYKIYSATGQEMISNNEEQISAIEVSISALPNGIYLMKLQAKDGRTIEKNFVKQ